MMEKALDRSEIEVIELDEHEGGDPFTPEKLVGIAVAGAFLSLTVYYLFNQLDDEKRKRLQSGVVSAVKGQVRRWGDKDEE